MTLHSASCAHGSANSQGSTHLPFSQDFSLGQSPSCWQPMGEQATPGLPVVPGGQVQMGLCSNGLHSAKAAQGLWSEQISAQMLFLQAWVPGQLALVSQPTVKQPSSGVPAKPSTHEQTGLWSTTLQAELGPQSQGSLQTLFTQALSSGQSSSLKQRSEMTGIFPQVPPGVVMWPSGQTQIIVRSGTVGRALQVALGSHGWIATHGSRHTPFRQAKLWWQSGSSLHSTSGSGRQKE